MCWALCGPKWVIPVATFLNLSSAVCLAAHSSSVTYLHLDWCSLVFFSGVNGNRDFFVILSEVVDDEVWLGLFVPSSEAFHNQGSQRFDVPFGIDASGDGARLEWECLTVAVVNGAATLIFFNFFKPICIPEYRH